ncbi:MAG: hypothetical protein ACI97A_001640 [Planctomycetota bacterium]
MRKSLISTLIALLLVSTGWSQSDVNLPAKENLEPVVQGRISWQGKYFKPREVLWPIGARGKNITLEKMLLDKVITDQSLLIGPKSKGIANCAIIVTEIEMGTKQPTIVPVEVKGLRFNERLVILRPGGRIRLRNFDTLGYRFIIASGNVVIREFELGPSSQLDLDLPKNNKLVLFEKTFPFLKCTVCQPSWAPVMVTDTEGQFEIRGLKPGPVKLAIWHEALGALVKTIDVLDKEPTVINLTQADFQKPGSVNTKLQDLGGDKDPVLKINDVAIGKKVFDEILKFVRTRYDDFTLPESTLQRYAIKAVFQPLVASLVHHRSRLAGLKENQAVVDVALAEGKSLKDAAILSGAGYAGMDGPWVGRRDLEPWIGSRIFAAPKNLVIGPIASANGMNYFLVTATTGRGDTEKRRFQHLFLSFRPDLTLTQLNVLIQELSGRARVEALDPALESSIAARNKD